MKEYPQIIKLYFYKSLKLPYGPIPIITIHAILINRNNIGI